MGRVGVGCCWMVEGELAFQFYVLEGEGGVKKAFSCPFHSLLNY